MKLHESTDRIERQIVLRAPRSRVWRAISDAKEFGDWFQAKIDGAFTPGAQIKGRISIPGYEHVTIDMTIERIEPESLMSFRWHPYSVDANYDYSSEPTTLVEFRLIEVEGGTELTVVEAGFDRIPLARRAEAFRMNDDGWVGQLENIAKYVAS
jgi:uncharacterized protein YndB with AHSA1/START domain